MINTVILRGCDSTLRAGALLTPFVMSSVSHPATDIPCAHLWVSHTCPGIYTGVMVIGLGRVGRGSLPATNIPRAHLCVSYSCPGIYTGGMVGVWTGRSGGGGSWGEDRIPSPTFLVPIFGSFTPVKVFIRSQLLRWLGWRVRVGMERR